MTIINNHKCNTSTNQTKYLFVYCSIIRYQINILKYQHNTKLISANLTSRVIPHRYHHTREQQHRHPSNIPQKVQHVHHHQQQIHDPATRHQYPPHLIQHSRKPSSSSRHQATLQHQHWQRQNQQPRKHQQYLQRKQHERPGQEYHQITKHAVAEQEISLHGDRHVKVYQQNH